MRINKYIAAGTALSRRGADTAIEQGRVQINGRTASSGIDVQDGDTVLLDDRIVKPLDKSITIILNKPRGLIVSRNGQGSRTVFEIIPSDYKTLNAVGRLDKDSSGLLLLTNDGALAQELQHPSQQKVKVYEVGLLVPLEPLHQQMISDHGIQLEDGLSRLGLQKISSDRLNWQVTMREGRNRQIRRTFAALGYTVNALHRTQFGPYKLGGLKSGEIREV